MRAMLPTLFLAGMLPATVAAQERAPKCEAVQVSSPQTKTAAVYRATEILDVSFDVVFPAGTSGDHILHLEVRTPNGKVFQKLDVPYSDDIQDRTTRPVRGYPRPLKVEPLQRAKVGDQEKTMVRVRFAVAGTSITKRGLYGRWSVVASAGQDACAQADFGLQP